MKSAAAQAGIDPALVERAARLVTAEDAARPSLVERLLGGRTRHRGEAHFPILLDEARAASLLSAIRIGTGQPGDGHSSALGLTSRSSDDGGAVLSLTARADHPGTSVTADLDRRGTLAVVGGLTLAGCLLTPILGGALAGAIVPGFEAVGSAIAVVTVVAAARGYWKASTRAASDRVARVMDTVGRFLTEGAGKTSGDAGDGPGGGAG